MFKNQLQKYLRFCTVSMIVKYRFLILKFTIDYVLYKYSKINQKNVKWPKWLVTPALSL